MSNHILTNLKKMSKLLTIDRFWGPVATVVFTVLYHLTAVSFGFTVAVGWLWVFAVLGAFIGGRKAGLIAATWAAVYAYYVTPGEDWPFLAQRVVIGFILTEIVGWQTHQLREYYKAADELLNGNAIRLNLALRELREAKEKMRQARKLIEQSEDGFGNVLTKVVGYGALRQRIADVKAQEAEGDG